MKALYTPLFLLIFLTLFISLPAQQYVQFNNELTNARWYNPATAGSNYIGILYRNEFSDLDKRFAPVSYALAADGSEWMGLSDLNIGLRLNFLADNVHLMKRTGVNASFAYYLLRDGSQNLSLGAVAGYVTQRLDIDSDVIYNSDLDAALFDAAESAGTFDGGLGAHYDVSISGNDRLNIDVALPQLFTSDLKYDTAGLLDLVPHIIGNIRYRFDAGLVGLEPSILYRGVMNSNETKKGKFDLALTGYFLEDLFAVGAGMRQDGKTFYGNVQVRPYGGLVIQGAFELNDVLGNTIEIGVAYDLGSGPKNCDHPLQAQLDKSVARAESLIAKTKNLRKEADGHKDKAYELVLKVEDVEGVGNKRIWAEQADQELLAMKGNLNELYQTRTIGLNLQNEAEEMQAQAAGEGNRIPCAKSSIKDIQQANYAIRKEVEAVAEPYKILEEELERRKIKWNLDMNIGELVRTNERAKLESHINQELAKLANKPRNLSPAKILEAGNSWIVNYSFPYGSENYEFSNNTEVKGLLTSISNTVSELLQAGVAIEAIDIWARLRSNNTSFEYSEVDKTYGNELGNAPVRISYDLIDAQSGAVRTGQTVEVQANNDLVEKQLVALKLLGLQKELFKSGTIVTVPHRFKVSTSNAQGFSEVYEIEVVIKR